MVKNYFKKNKILNIIGIIALSIIILYEVTDSIPELFKYADFIFKLISDLSLAYLGGLIFYIVQSYIPRETQLKKINKCIYKYVEDITKEVESISKINKDSYLIDKSDLICNSNQSQISYYNNFEAIKFSINKISLRCKDILVFTSLIDEELINLVNDIYIKGENNKFILYYKAYSLNLDCSNILVEQISETIYEYIELVSKLNNHLEQSI